MTTTDQPVETLHHALEDRYRTYTSRLARLTLSGGRSGQGGYDEATRDALIAWARRGVADAADALRRMSDGTYGICERCGGEIPAGRLTARPDTRVCGSCRP
jgi:DnaK suppressor protein